MGRKARTWITIVAVLAAGIMASTCVASPAWAGTARNDRTIYLGGSDVQGGTACVRRDLWLIGDNYRWYVSMSHGDWTASNVSMRSGNYSWNTCVHGVPGQKGWYYATMRMWGWAPLNFDATITTGRWWHPVAADETLYSSVITN
jgi:hypothetical protein